MVIIKKEEISTGRVKDLILKEISGQKEACVIVAVDNLNIFEYFGVIDSKIIFVFNSERFSETDVKKIKKIYSNKKFSFIIGNHKLSNLEQSRSDHYSTKFPVEMLASTKKMLTEPLQKCLAISAITLEQKEISYGNTVIAAAGDILALNTAAVIKPAFFSNLIDSKIIRIICKTYD